MFSPTFSTMWSNVLRLLFRATIRREDPGAVISSPALHFVQNIYSRSTPVTKFLKRKRTSRLSGKRLQTQVHRTSTSQCTALFPLQYRAHYKCFSKTWYLERCSGVNFNRNLCSSKLHRVTRLYTSWESKRAVLNLCSLLFAEVLLLYLIYSVVLWVGIVRPIE